MEGEKKYTGLKRVLFGILLLGISVPMIQHVTEFSNVRPLWGAVENAPPAELSMKSWMDGSYQVQTDKYLNDGFGFRPSFVRLHNQLQFSLFSIPHANGVLIGKDWYLYESSYIRAYYGQDFIGDSLILEKTRKLKYINDHLEAQGKSLVVMFAPGKGTFFPEYFPDSLIAKKGRTNYAAYIEAFKKYDLPCMDFNKWFVKMKPSSPHPLYPKGGIHWSKYGEMIALDSMVRYIEHASNRKLPKLVIDGYDVKNKNENGDYDIGEGMNLLFPIPTYPMAYPRFHVEHPERNTTRVLFISDSYFWGIYNYGFTKNLFGNGQFWFYFNEIYNADGVREGLAEDRQLLDEIKKFDVIVLISTDANLNKFTNGFIDKYYAAAKH